MVAMFIIAGKKCNELECVRGRGGWPMPWVGGWVVGREGGGVRWGVGGGGADKQLSIPRDKKQLRHITLSVSLCLSVSVFVGLSICRSLSLFLCLSTIISDQTLLPSVSSRV